MPEKPEEGLVVFAHLSVQDTERVLIHLVRWGLWSPPDMVHDTDLNLLMTTSKLGTALIWKMLEKLELLPTGETTFRPVGTAHQQHRGALNKNRPN